MKTLVLSVLLVICCTARAGAQQVDSSCLVPWQDSPDCPCNYDPSIVWFNPDSVKVDICNDGQYLNEFAKDQFIVFFQYYIIPIPDSIAIKGQDTAIHSWEDIDTVYPALRDSFQNLEKKFGAFTLRRFDPGGDTSYPGDKEWAINFNTYLNVDTVDTALSTFPDINWPIGGASFGGNPSFFESVNKSAIVGDIREWPQPANSEVNVSGTGIISNPKFTDQLGRELTLPMVLNDNALTIDVSKQPNGIIYCSILGSFFNIIIQH